MSKEQFLFNKAIDRVNFFLKLTGIYISAEDEHRSLGERLSHRWFFCLNFICMIADATSSLGLIPQLTRQELIYLIPCLTLCFIGIFKSYFFVSCHHNVVDLIRTLRNLQTIQEINEEVEMKLEKKYLPFLYRTNNMLLMFAITAIIMFFIGLIVIIVSHYKATNEIQLVLPFIIWYPFDALDIKYWPFAMVHQSWSGWVVVLFVYGPDCFFYTVCMFIHVQFCSLKLDLLQLARELQGEGRRGFIALVHRHRELLRCINLLEIIYGKSTLFNVVSSSLIICVTGFNVTAIDNLAIMAPFTPFLSVGALQIYLFCYYGDLLMQDSLNVSEAVYSTEWYDLDSAHMKYCLFMLLRAQIPCKITAYGFMDINLNGFTTILSSAASYFTLLKTMYDTKK